MSVVYSFVVTD